MRGPGRESRLSRAPDAVPAPAEATPTAVGGYERCFAILVPRPGPVRTEPNEGFIWALLGSNHRCCPRAVVVDEPLNFPIEELEIQIDWLRRPVGDADTHQLGEDRPKGCEGTLVDGRGEPRGSRPQPMTSNLPTAGEGSRFPAESLARTLNLCLASARCLTFFGEEHGLNLLLIELAFENRALLVGAKQLNVNRGFFGFVRRCWLVIVVWGGSFSGERRIGHGPWVKALVGH